MTEESYVAADDHPLMLDALYTVFADQQQFNIVATARSFPEVVAAALATPADLLILDLIGMHVSAVTMVERLRRDAPHLKVVILSSRVDMAPELLRAGAVGYVTKAERSSVLLAAVAAVAAGGIFCSPHVQEYLERAKGEESFTPQEWLTLKLLAHDPETSRIAEAMGIGHGAVNNNVSHMLRKKNFTNRNQLRDWYLLAYGIES
jgi:DNA-binding NarL/FixJ family response regulator